MNPIKYNNIDSYLENISQEGFPNVFLLWGEDFLVKEKRDLIISYLLPQEEKTISSEVLEGESATAASVFNAISTLCVFLKKRVVTVKNAEFIQSVKNTEKSTALKRLSDFIEKGIPANNYLIITGQKVDKRASLFKNILKNGMAVDCSIPMGSKKSDLNEQRLFLEHITRRILTQENKVMNQEAFQNLLNLTGFEPATFADNLQKLSAYTGSKQIIDGSDIEALVNRTRKDPVFDFTNALFEKDTEKALFFLTSLLNEGFHPLQILKASVKQLRKIYTAKLYIQKINSSVRRVWNRNHDFSSFKQITLPEVIRAENEFTESNRNITAKSDLLPGINQKNAYPLFKTFKKADHFSRFQLEKMFKRAGDLDFKLRSSTSNAKILLKDFVLSVCLNGE